MSDHHSAVGVTQGMNDHDRNPLDVVVVPVLQGNSSGPNSENGFWIVVSLRKLNFAFLSVAFFFLLTACREKEQLVKIEGQAQGTTYHITYFSKDNVSYKTQIDSLLKQLDLSLSTYVPESIISRINGNDNTVEVDDHFSSVFTKAIEVSKKTNGLFDVTVAPIINAYGFGFTAKENVNSKMIDSLRQFVGYRMVRLSGNKLVKEKPEIMVDFNAIAQGYSVDVLASFLEDKDINSYLVELGGEVKAKGTKENNEPWRVGIDQPEENFPGSRNLKAVVKLKDMAMATSGNYRRYYEENGRKYAHIIHPATGYPAKHHLLSASVFAIDCMTADAYATAFMVMGVEQARQFLSENKAVELEVFLIYDDNGDWKTYASEGLKEWIEEIP
jgi:thiamine biosynthesis lipoprotein